MNRSSKYHIYSLFLFSLWGFAIISVVFVLGVTTQKYLIALEKNFTARSRSIKIVERVCYDPMNNVELRIEAMCEDAKHIMARSPWFWALIETAESLPAVFCGTAGCSANLMSAAGEVTKICLSFLVIVVFVLYVLRSCFYKWRGKYDDSRYNLGYEIDRTAGNRIFYTSLGNATISEVSEETPPRRPPMQISVGRDKND